jgi:signal transduction histidine kinase
MSRRRPRTWPIRTWIAGASAVTFVLTLTVIFTVLTMAGDDPPEDQMAVAAASLRAESARWNDRAWQQTITPQLARRDMALMITIDGTEVYRTTNAPSFLASDPVTSAPPEPDAGSRRWMTHVIDADDPESRSRAILAMAIEPDESGTTVFIVVALALLAVGAAVAWGVGRTVARPLRATAAGAIQVAKGDLAVSLPRSRVREVDQVNTTFTTMTTELRNALHRQAELEQERRVFITAVAHDLRTPLFTLRGYLDGLDAGVAETPESRRHYLQRARHNAQTLERLVGDLFDYTRLEYLDQQPERQPLDLSVLARQLVHDHRNVAEDRDVTLIFDSACPPCPIEGDAHQLNRAITNVIANALEHTPPGGRVTVSCDQDRGTARFTVTDTGRGIPETDRPHLFKPLYRGDSTRHRTPTGSGLGLAIADRILTAHGGDLAFDDSYTGGARFVGSLPLP